MSDFRERFDNFMVPLLILSGIAAFIAFMVLVSYILRGGH